MNAFYKLDKINYTNLKTNKQKTNKQKERKH